MLEQGFIPPDYMNQVKRHLNITWSDDDTDQKVADMMMDAEIALNHKLGAEIYYFAPGAERLLYLNYLLYAWNDCLEEFDSAYRAEILQIRHKYEVEAYKTSEESEDEEI